MFLKTQTKGEPFDFGAERQAAYTEAANYIRARKLAQGNPAGVADRLSVVSVSNGTGSAFARFDAVTLGSPPGDPSTDFDAWANRIILSGTQPVTGDRGKFGVCLEPIASGATGYVVVAGVVPCQVSIPTNGAWIDWADIANASHDLELQPHGTARVIWRESGTTGTKWAYVQLGCDRGVVELKAVADGAITAGSSGTVSVYDGGSDSSYNVTAHLNWMHGSENVSSGKELLIRWFEDEAKWVIVAAECE